jgi:hypothetical protein
VVEQFPPGPEQFPPLLPPLELPLLELPPLELLLLELPPLELPLLEPPLLELPPPEPLEQASPPPATPRAMEKKIGNERMDVPEIFLMMTYSRAPLVLWLLGPRGQQPSHRNRQGRS